MNSLNFGRGPCLAVDLMVLRWVQQVDDLYHRQPIDGASTEHHHFQNYANQAPSLTKMTNDAHDNEFSASVLCLMQKQKQIKFISII